MQLRFVIVDDSDIVISLHTEVLAFSNLSLEPLSALNGQLALELLSKQDIPDATYVILLDINMPIMDGWQFLDALQHKTQMPNIKVIMITSSIDAKDKARASNYKAVIGFFEKPLSTEDCNLIKQLPEIEHYFNKSA